MSKYVYIQLALLQLQSLMKSFRYDDDVNKDINRTIISRGIARPSVIVGQLNSCN